MSGRKLSARSPPSARKNRAFTPRQPKAETCAYSTAPTTSYRLQTGFTYSIRLEPSGPASTTFTYHGTSQAGPLPMPCLCIHAPPWGTLEKLFSSGS